MNQQRYTSAQQITAEIDRAKAAAQLLFEKADSLESQAMAYSQRQDGNYEWIVKLKMGAADHNRKMASTIVNVTCRNLKQKLAEFNTMMLPGMGFTDQSIPRTNR
jgi:hypothetical protein